MTAATLCLQVGGGSRRTFSRSWTIPGCWRLRLFSVQTLYESLLQLQLIRQVLEWHSEQVLF